MDEAIVLEISTIVGTCINRHTSMALALTFTHLSHKRMGLRFHPSLNNGERNTRTGRINESSSSYR
jgi:hypothetical protein